MPGGRAAHDSAADSRLDLTIGSGHPPVANRRRYSPSPTLKENPNDVEPAVDPADDPGLREPGNGIEGMTSARLDERAADSARQTLTSALRAACERCRSAEVEGVVVVFLAGSRVLDVAVQPLLDRAAHASTRVPAEADHAVLIAVADPDQAGEQAALAHLDVLVGQVRTADIVVDAEVFVARLAPGERWTDLIDPDHPGGRLPAAPRWQHLPGTCPATANRKDDVAPAAGIVGAA
ncbi:hypothetical protein [Nocardia tengchongensis]|uniref:hypothetical protein n=1 Tax=Nocardia tengchongensis TaxID=2055889 RepID=UPI0036545D09